MIKIIPSTLSLLTTLVFTSNVIAFEIKPEPKHYFATVTTENSKVATKKKVTLINYKLTAEEHSALLSNLKSQYTYTAKNDLPASYQLGMNKVPVLDQGRHGTCVTFAQTAALDALLNKGDYISQLCSLELGKNFENNGYLPGGWNGSFGPLVLNQMLQFGYINKDTQTKKRCAGVSEYPTEIESDEGKAMTLDEFAQKHENYVGSFGFPKWVWIPFLNVFDRFEHQFKDVATAERALNNIKESLTKGSRVTFGVMLFSSQACHDMACATLNKKHDTWAMTDDIIEQGFLLGGHEMVITGYDDNATAKDDAGKLHKGLLTLRNSWGADVGDKGDYYMTYDYFIKNASEAQQITEFKDEQK